jgi:hypothetical protein
MSSIDLTGRMSAEIEFFGDCDEMGLAWNWDMAQGPAPSTDHDCDHDCDCDFI